MKYKSYLQSCSQQSREVYKTAVPMLKNVALKADTGLEALALSVSKNLDKFLLYDSTSSSVIVD